MPFSIDPTTLPSPSRCPPQEELPEPFETFDGETVGSPEKWAERRRELQQLFQHYVYGYTPPAPDIVTDVERTTNVLGGQADLTEVTIEFADLQEAAPAITLALFTPAGTDSDSVPVVLALNRFGNHTVVEDEDVSIPPAAREHGSDERGTGQEGWRIDRVLDRGYGFATFHSADIDPDRNGFTDGIHPHYDPPGPPGTEWGTLAAWAWGLQRCVDYLRTDDRVRADEIAVTGHSRAGKAALFAGATDDRIGLVAPHQSGTGGCVPARDNGQETVADITGSFPHWFADTFSAFAGQVDRLPVDQHLLVSLVAPRPLIDTAGARDYWSNPGRSLDSLRAADPVYELLGVDGVIGDGILYGDEEITDANTGRLLQFRRETAHTLHGAYWDAILDFADLHFES
jgi:hypothetical protein